MVTKSNFIKATDCFNTFESNVPAYYFRRTYSAQQKGSAKITIAACGFYELYCNGTRITKGFLSPYISNTNDYIYYDVYDVTLSQGENVFGVLLGNGLQNNPGGYIWDFDKADFRSAPMFAISVTQGDQLLFTSDTQFKIAPSPIRSDDYRFGEYYDANYEQADWLEADFDDSDWENALPAVAPRGELQYADVPPIVKEAELPPVAITPCGDGYLYDFGLNHAGVCRLTIQGTKGQKVEMQFADALANGDLDLAQIWFPAEQWDYDKNLVHKDTYICKGTGTECYQPFFTYHGFRYVKVSGITQEQATRELLTYLVYHTRLNTRGDFTCSDPVVNQLQEMTRRSILANFYHFPTDCPQREKNGWTADAALSCEAALLNFDPEVNYREWMRNIRKAQKPNGKLPGIVPTGGWGFDWGNGPAWDCVLAWLPYYTYCYRGETEMIRESAEAFIRYLTYLRGRCDEKGLLSIGLGDWCHVGGIEPKAPLIVTDTLTSMDIAEKMAVMLDAIGLQEQADYARREAASYKASFRRELVDWDTMAVSGNCQTSQSMALHLGIFYPEEEGAAFRKLLELIHAEDDHMDVGVLGGRVLFHVLTKFGYSDLAYKIITREDYPSYGNWVKRGATTLWERFFPDASDSMNHHFWGDISAWFIKCLAGIRFNPDGNDPNFVKIKPSFVNALEHVSAWYMAPSGKIQVSWKREGDVVILDVQIPQGMRAEAELENGCRFPDGSHTKSITAGRYEITI